MPVFTVAILPVVEFNVVIVPDVALQMSDVVVPVIFAVVEFKVVILPVVEFVVVIVPEVALQTPDVVVPVIFAVVEFKVVILPVVEFNVVAVVELVPAFKTIGKLFVLTIKPEVLHIASA